MLSTLQDGAGAETPTAPVPQKSLYTVLEEKKTSVSSNQLFGAARTYVLPSAGASGTGGTGRAPGQVVSYVIFSLLSLIVFLQYKIFFSIPFSA